MVAFIRDICSRVNVRLFLTGGEPLARLDIGRALCSLASIEGVIYVGLFTSGCLRNDHGDLIPLDMSQAVRLRRAGLSGCYVSLYSDSEATHEWITGVPGSFAVTRHSIVNFVAAGVEARVHCPIMKVNHHSLVSLALDSATLGVTEMRFLRLVRHGRAAKCWAQIGLSGEQQKAAVITAMGRIHAQSAVHASVAGFPELFDCRPFGTAKGCQAGLRLFYVDWRGEVFPCACKKRDRRAPLGSIDDDGWAERILYSAVGYRRACLQDV